MKPVIIAQLICIPFSEVILKKDEKEGMYKIMASNVSVAMMMILRSIFLFLNVTSAEK